MKYVSDSIKMAGLDTCRDLGPYLGYWHNILYIDRLLPLADELIKQQELLYTMEMAVDQPTKPVIKYVNGEAVDFDYGEYCRNKPSWDHTAQWLQYFKEYDYNGLLHVGCQNFEAWEKDIDSLVCVKARRRADETYEEFRTCRGMGPKLTPEELAGLSASWAEQANEPW